MKKLWVSQFSVLSLWLSGYGDSTSAGDSCFYGKVVFQDGTPVESGSVTLTQWRNSARLTDVDEFQVEVPIDKGGRFWVCGDFDTLRIDRIQSRGDWLYEKFPRSGEPDIVGNRMYVLDENVASISGADWYVPMQQKPAVFVMLWPEFGSPIVWPSRGGKDMLADGDVVWNEGVRPINPSVPIDEIDG